MARVLKNNRGQTSIEYLMLMAVTFVAAYIMITRPLAGFVSGMITEIRVGILNVIQHGEWAPGQIITPGQPGHPGDPKRLRPVHLSG